MTLEPGQWWTAHAQNIVPGSETDSSSSMADHTDHDSMAWWLGKYTNNSATTDTDTDCSEYFVITIYHSFYFLSIETDGLDHSKILHRLYNTNY